MKILHSVTASTNSAKYTIKSVSDEGTYYLVKDWRKNKELWVSKEKMDRHPEWWFTSSGKAKQSLKSLLSVMDEYLSDTFTVVDMSGNETPLNVKELGFDHIPEYWDDDIDACDKIMASTSFKYADRVEFEDIFPSDHDISFFFTSDDATYAKKLLGNVQGLTGFSIQVSLPKDYNGNWQEALIYISPKTSDGHGGESDFDWTDITFDISDADMQSLVDQSWAEYKKRGWDDIDACNKVISSTRYKANMVSASDDGFVQLVEYPESDIEEFIEYGKWYVAGYLQSNYRGLMEDLYSDDFEEILATAADMAGKGLYVAITNRADGRYERYTPDDFEEAASYGEYPDHIREDLAL